jgi:triacylglycerol lipase
LEQLHLLLEKGTPTEAMVNKEGGRPERPYIVTGHSLGAALTTLFVMENKKKQKFDITTLCTFASPRVGNMSFARVFNLLCIASWRIVNSQDLVPKLPPYIPLILDYEHVNTAYEFSSQGMVKPNPVCRHSMETYLHWLNANLPVDGCCEP